MKFYLLSRTGKSFRCIVLLFSTLIFSLTVSAQLGHTIRGKVRTADGANVSQAYVDLQSGNGARIGQTTTNAEGDFYYTGLTNNSYALLVSLIDHQTATVDVRFSKVVGAGDTGETQFVEVVLKPQKGAGVPRAAATFFQNVPPEALKKFDEATKLLKENKTDQALASIQQALKIFPDYYDAHLTLASALAKLNRLNEAVVELEQARKVNARDAGLYHLFGMILMQKQLPEPAAEVLAEAIRLSPADPQLPYLRATALIDSAALIDPAKPTDANRRKQILQDAERLLLAAFDLSGKKLFLIYLQMARIFEKRNEPKRAADELEKYLRSSPNDKNAAAIRSAIERLRGRS